MPHQGLLERSFQPLCQSFLLLATVPPSLSIAHWNLWCKALTCSFLVQPPTLERRLRLPLGSWTTSVSLLWPWYWIPLEDWLYRRMGNSWEFYARLPTTRRQQRFLYGGTAPTLPPDALLATTNHGGDLWRCTGSRLPFRPTKTAPLATLNQMLVHLPAADQGAVHRATVPDNAVNIAHVICLHKATAVSNGSFKLARGTSAYTIMGTDARKRIVGINAVPGSPLAQGAYRSELAGISGVITVVNAICKLHSITSGMIEMGLDGKEALKQAAGNWPLSPAQADFDMLSDVCAKLAASPITWRWHWVCGHQDKHVPHHRLDFWARTNVEMDSLAKAFWEALDAAKVAIPNPPFAYEGWSLYHRQNKLSQVHKKDLYDPLWAPQRLTGSIIATN
jgi:hypothetical protein